MKINWFKRVAIFIAIAVIDIVLLSNTYTLCTWYPFSRILNGNQLTNTIKFSNDDSLYNAVISDPQISESLHSGVPSKRNRSQWTIPFIKNDGSTVLHYISTSFNTDLFIFLSLLIAAGTIHLAWGVVIFFVRKINKSARYYSIFSIIFGALFFSYADLICTGNQITMLAAHGALLYFSITGISELLKVSQRIRRILSLCTLTTVVLLIAFHLFSPFSLINRASFRIVAISILLLFFTVSGIGVFKNRERIHHIRALLVVTLAASFGIIIPASAILLSTWIDFPVPLAVITLFSSIVPLTLGREFIERSRLTEYVIKTIYNIRFIIDFSTALCLGLIFYVYTLKLTTLYNSIVYIVFASSLLLLVRSAIIEHIRTNRHASGDKLTLSLQLIAEISVLPKALEKRLDAIFEQMRMHLGIKYLKIGIITTPATVRLDGYENFFRYIDSSGSLAKQYESYRDIIRKDYLFENYAVDYFAGAHNSRYSIIIPVEFESRVPCLVFASDKESAAPFYSAEFHYIQSAALLVYQMIENELLFQQYLLKGKYEEELDNASYIQMRLFPVELPLSSGIDISFYSRPFNKVTGDYFDIVSLPKNRSAIAVGDITGHGLPAAMLHSTTAALVNALLQEGVALTEVMEYLNTFLIEKYRGHELITLLLAIYDPETRILSYVNAGHNLPLLYENGSKTIQSVHQRNHILGVMDTPEYQESSVRLERGDKIFFYTDGLVDIRTESGHSMGEEPVIAIIMENAANPGESIIEKIGHLVDNADQSDIPDDITAVCMTIE